MNAVVLQFPAKVRRTAKRRLDKVELEARHSWIMRHRNEWDNVETDGRRYHTPIEEQMRPHLNRICGFKEKTLAEMRKDVANGRKLIEKRNAVKTWLESMGANLDDIKDAEQALFFAFDQLA